MNKVARILVVDGSIPSPGYGSWSQRIEYLLQQYTGNRFDYLLSAHSDTGFNSANTIRYKCRQQKNKVLNKLIPGWRYRHYERALANIIDKHNTAIICIIDSLRLKNAIWDCICKNGWQKRIRLLYYQCGFSKYIAPANYERFIEGIDECIYLTRNAYRFDLRHNSSMPFPVSVLHNPVNHHIFHPVSASEKQLLREKLGMEDATHFIWASHDRPKKGLEVVLDAWSRFYDPSKNIVLHVVGVKRHELYPGVRFHGKVHSAEMHSWFKAADVGVFSSLWPEGFSLSLAEQISCGLFCIASTAGCVEEYFKPGKHGIAIDEPNIVEEWVKSLGLSLEQLPAFRAAAAERDQPPFLTYDAWCEKFQQIFDNVERRMRFAS